MRDLTDSCGEWVGFWVQLLTKGHMSLTLSFAEGRILGSGNDRVGPFSVSGAYTGDGGVVFSKSYPRHAVQYLGNWDGLVISGQWRIERMWLGGTGRFEIWPICEEGRENIGEEKREEPAASA